ncbi:hypothetical protein CH063_12503 [Colletotrichum higginsianum]|uniref:Uncharacterized protein n=1 Tax=Colletotrichum higginsianum (strain IMI 349063) TaxID=759273 RepID=H1VQM9_COLHI|nr:hypothetical protein CH063_12503 [Colletotrichum higginsianum]
MRHSALSFHRLPVEGGWPRLFLPFVADKVPLGKVHLPDGPLDEDGLERGRRVGAVGGGGIAGGEGYYAQDGTVLVGVPPPRLALGALLGLGLLVAVA